MKRLVLTGMALAVLLAASGRAVADANDGVVTFGSLKSLDAKEARAKVESWLKIVGMSDTAKINSIWQHDERTVLDRVADSFALVNDNVRQIMTGARDTLQPAPTKVPAFFSDEKVPAFVRSNIALAYARALSNRRIHEEALAALNLFRPEQVIDPASFLFHRAVCEHSLLKKEEATRTIGRLLSDADNSPQRYMAVSALMLLDMQTWKNKDLGEIARKMENIERRLDLARGGPVTQKLQKEVIMRLDELIKKLENDSKKGGGS